MKIKGLLGLLAILGVVCAPSYALCQDDNDTTDELIDKAFIDAINAVDGNTWTATEYKGMTDRPISYIKSLLGVKTSLFNRSDDNVHEIDASSLDNDDSFKITSRKGTNPLLSALEWPSLPRAKWPKNKTDALPSSFDSREEWGTMCPIMKDIRDQAGCGSCYASSFASAASDRLCLASRGSKKVKLSTSDPLSCCGAKCGDGCNGGWLEPVWQYYIHKGVVSGSEYVDSNTSTGSNVCWPYEFAPCQHHNEGERPKCEGEGGDTPKCRSQCTGNTLKFKQDKQYGRVAYSVANNEKQIMAEIFHNGPVQAAFIVYADFPTYKSGIYKKTRGTQLGGHAIKIIGWGEENGTKYWTIANSWNTDFGEGGFFRMIRGQNECGIESLVYAGLPKL